MQFRIIKKEFGVTGEVFYYLLQQRKFCIWFTMTHDDYRALMGRGRRHTERGRSSVQANRLSEITDYLDNLIAYLKKDREGAEETNLLSQRTTVISVKEV